jgi:predicted solute-binding protein
MVDSNVNGDRSFTIASSELNSCHAMRLSTRLGVVDYLNMQPLVDGLDAALGPRFEIVHARPSALARDLQRGALDVGMVPVAALFANPDWTIVKTGDGDGSMIGARGPVASVLLLGAGDPEAWRRLRPDSHSMTSNALARVILEGKYGLKPAIGEPIPADDWEMPGNPEQGDAFVLIGSRALRWRDWKAAAGPSAVLDMGHEWNLWTGLPFVFAVWAARPGLDPALLADLADKLEAHKRRNRGRLDAIAAGWRGLAYDRMTPEQAADYFRNSIDYDLDAAALEGLERFREEGKKIGAFSGVASQVN